MSETNIPEQPASVARGSSVVSGSTAKSRTVHMCVNIQGVLRWPDKDLRNMFTDENDQQRPAREIRDWLKLQLALGKRVLPMGKPCEGWSDQTGCPGHPEP